MPQQPLLHGRQRDRLLRGGGRRGLQPPGAPAEILPGAPGRHHQVPLAPRAPGPHPAAGSDPLRPSRPHSPARPPLAPSFPLERGASVPLCRPGQRRWCASRRCYGDPGVGPKYIKDNQRFLTAPPARASPWVETAWKWLLAVGFNQPRCVAPAAAGVRCRNSYGRLCPARQPEGRRSVPGRP